MPGQWLNEAWARQLQQKAESRIQLLEENENELLLTRLLNCRWTRLVKMILGSLIICDPADGTGRQE
jgi:hypothetical protein